MAGKMDPFSDVFPIENGDIPTSYVRNYQRVKHFKLWKMLIPWTILGPTDPNHPQSPPGL